jgi:uncharacterized protein YggE
MSRLSQNVEADANAPQVSDQAAIDVTATVNQSTVNAALATVVTKLNQIINALQAAGVVRP